MNAQVNLPIELYDVLERHLGREDGRAVAKVISHSLELIEDRSHDVAEQRKREIMEEMRNALVTKEFLHQELQLVRKDFNKDMDGIRKDMDLLRKEVKVELAQMDKKFTVYFLALLFAILFVNKDAITLLGNLLGLVKP
ncbi:hypothetical protein [Methylomagnum sp.]